MYTTQFFSLFTFYAHIECDLWHIQMVLIFVWIRILFKFGWFGIALLLEYTTLKSSFRKQLTSNKKYKHRNIYKTSYLNWFDHGKQPKDTLLVVFSPVLKKHKIMLINSDCNEFLINETFSFITLLVKCKIKIDIYFSLKKRKIENQHFFDMIMFTFLS